MPSWVVYATSYFIVCIRILCLEAGLSIFVATCFENNGVLATYANILPVYHPPSFYNILPLCITNITLRRLWPNSLCAVILERLFFHSALLTSSARVFLHCCKNISPSNTLAPTEASYKPCFATEITATTTANEQRTITVPNTTIGDGEKNATLNNKCNKHCSIIDIWQGYIAPGDNHVDVMTT